MRSLLFILVCFLCAGRVLAVEPPAVERLAAGMTGAFTTADQARGDQNFRDVTLHVAPIWTDRADGPWLYFEQALTDAPDHPYKQHVYQIAARTEGALELRIFDLPDPISATGAWKDPALLAKLSPAGLISHLDCTVILRAQPDGAFKGGTEGKGCASTLRGASYATSEVTVSSRQLITWDRGYNASGAQVWGSIHGGYEFKKL